MYLMLIFLECDVIFDIFIFNNGDIMNNDYYIFIYIRSN